MHAQKCTILPVHVNVLNIVFFDHLTFITTRASIGGQHYLATIVKLRYNLGKCMLNPTALRMAKTQ